METVRYLVTGFPGGLRRMPPPGTKLWEELNYLRRISS